MTAVVHKLLRSKPFYLSGPMPCPYLSDRVERKLFTRLDDDAEDKRAALNALLTRAGFRRSHDVVYRPACPGCSACVPVRIPVDGFRESRTLRRLGARNRDVTLEITAPRLTREHHELFVQYQLVRHPDGDMAHMAFDDFSAMAFRESPGSFLLEVRDRVAGGGHGRLLGCLIADHVHDGFSAVYSFYCPLQPRRSLGVFLVHALVRRAAQKNLPYVYLGYWICRARKMAYKSRFRPLQALGPEGWREMPRFDAAVTEIRPAQPGRPVSA